MFKLNFHYFVFLSISTTICCQPTGNIFPLSIIHINDFHASFEETDQWGKPCGSGEKCIGGFSRMYQTITSLKKENENSLILNAGDNFQGTIWYSVFGLNITQYFMNKIRFDAYTLGNHEFDDGVDGAIQFMKYLNSPIVLANIDDSKEPLFQGLYTKSIVIEKNGKRIGIIGVLLTRTKEKSQVRCLKFLDESESINREAERLVKEKNVFTNIIVSHCGYPLEMEMARKATNKISVIVGGHSHSLLWTGDNVPSKSEKPEGPYPTVIQRKDGKKVLVIQALSMARYVGNITINYNMYGDIINWSGAPIFQNSGLPQNKKMNDELDFCKNKLNERTREVLGQTLTDLSSVNCNEIECTLGNFIADAMVYNELRKGKFMVNTPLAAINCGSLKETIPKGNITFGQLLAASPFNNKIVSGNIKGKYLLNALDHAVESIGEWESRLLQVSGMQIKYDLTQPKTKQLIYAKARSANFDNITYVDIAPDKEYRISILSFMAQGGDGFMMFKDNLTNIDIGASLTDILKEYVKEKSPFWKEINERLTFVRN